MPIKDAFIAELKHEASLTKKMLERVPLEKAEWKPHEKSMSLGRLATHIAENFKWIADIKNIDDFDFAARPFKAHVAASQDELISIFQTNLDTAVNELSSMQDEDFSKPWIVRVGDKVMFNTPKKVAIRGWALSHHIHHRGQLSVYLRLLNVPVPGMYGPSADER
ncbi:DinB family protein [Terrimonas pollutisoli]|uniref:DinB family protein n=1 Tax=Terrimonas pollutisoli TaxID=3034147 RepID=UPI0023EC48E5|nr:DinB family protein [Terrimonas sp. H1YJ31]